MVPKFPITRLTVAHGVTVLKRLKVTPSLPAGPKLLAMLWYRSPLKIVSRCSSRVVTSSPTWRMAHWTEPSRTGFPGRFEIVGGGGRRPAERVRRGSENEAVVAVEQVLDEPDAAARR